MSSMWFKDQTCFVNMSWGMIGLYIYRYKRTLAGESERDLALFGKHSLQAGGTAVAANAGVPDRFFNHLLQ